MNKEVLVLGGGGREYAFGWALKRSGVKHAVDILTAPGNAGTAELGENVPIDPENVDKVAEFAAQRKPFLIIVGSEGPLAKGVVNAVAERGIPIVGPTQQAARLETSKGWAGEFLQRHGIPAPESAFFEDFRLAKEYIENYKNPCVIKADGLTGGKGVEVCSTKEEALLALEKITNKYGEKVVVQERLYGREASVIAITDGETVLPLLPAEDYKQLLDEDKGPNTGGMGGVCPFWEVVSPAELEKIRQEILIPTVEGMASEGKPFQGFLYAGLIKTKDGKFKVLEFNCRGGDPEMQLILPLLNTPLLPVLTAAVKGKLSQIQLSWKQKFALGVVLASEGYPGKPITEREIFGAERWKHQFSQDHLVVEAGTKIIGGKKVTSSGRVLTIVGIGSTVGEAGREAYSRILRTDQTAKGSDSPWKIHFLGNVLRTDIGQRGKPRNL